MRSFSKSVISKIFFGVVTIFNLGLAANTLKDLDSGSSGYTQEKFSTEGKVYCVTAEGVIIACGTSTTPCEGVPACE